MSWNLNERRLPTPSVDYLDLRTGDPPLRYSHGNGEGSAFYAEEVPYARLINMIVEAEVGLEPLPPPTALR
jgi:hypothetical protein